ncbi:MAG: hypothetical protein P1P89_12870 [Desulfobacterales bacterium]|nr:hypothetical protein [Desulfobacterales bacterium]
MAGQITISTWLFLLLVIIAAIAVLDRVLIPSSRWFLRRRINRVIEEIGTRLDIEIRPFQLTKRQVLVDRLAYDPKVIEAIQSYAREHDMPWKSSRTRFWPTPGKSYPPLTPFSISGPDTGSPKK